MIQAPRMLLLLVLLSLAVIPVAAADVTANTLLPRIHIIATGGTIAGTASDATSLVHYDPGNLSVDALVSLVPGLDRHATVTGERFSNLNSDDISPAHWLNLSRRVNALLESADVDGIVITHGTDTLEETAYFLSLVTPEGKPVVVTGAMRPATALSADGPLNLYNAIVLAGSPDAKGKGFSSRSTGRSTAHVIPPRQTRSRLQHSDRGTLVLSDTWTRAGPGSITCRQETRQLPRPSA